MSLQVWLPLTKDLRQQGLSNVTVTNNGATYASTGGKLGGCYSFNGSSYITVQDVVLQNIWSYSCWLYSDISSRSWEVVMACNINGGDADMQLGLYTRPSGNIIQNTANGQYNASISMTYGQWNHFVGTFDGTNLKTYLNGVLVNTKAITNAKLDRPKLTIGARCRGSSYDCYFQGLLNDVRIYDHCLSQMEVKEISKGLVLHYPLSRNGLGQENLLKNSGDLTLWNKESGINCEYDSTVNMYKIYSTTRESSRWGIYQDYAVTVSTDTNYTFSLTGKTDGYSAYLSFGAGTSWPTNYIAFTNNKQRLSKTLTIPAGTTNIRVYLAMYPQTGGGHVYFEKPKLEEGSTSTPWCPNSSDALATTMGLNSTTEYDCSGFCNNGTRTGTFSWTSDTPKYNVSQYFNGSSYILTDSGTFSWFDFDKCTVSVWMKPTSTPSSWAGTFGIAHNNSAGNKSFVIGNYGGTFTVQSANGSWVNIQSSTLPVNEWHHCVATLDGTIIKMYFDGELVNTYTTSWGSTTVASDTRVQVGIDLPGSDEIYQGYYSDARIYTTALSSEDVLELYHTAAHIDNLGNTWVYQYNEI